MAFNIEYIVKMVDEFSGVAKGISISMVNIERKARHLRRALHPIEKQLDGIRSALHHMEHQLKQAGRVMTESFTLPLGALAGFSIKAMMNVDDLKASLTNAGVSAKDLGGVTANLQGIANNGIGDISSIRDASAALLEAGVRTQDLSGMMKNLGNIAAGSGNKIEDIAGLVAQIKSQGKLTAGNLPDLEKFGLLKPLMSHEMFKGRHLNISNGKDLKLFNKALAEGVISWGTFNQLTKDVANKNGIYANAIAENAKTIGGAFVGLKNSAMFSLSKLGTEITEHFHLIDRMNTAKNQVLNFGKSFDVFIKAHPILTKLVLDIGGILAAVGPTLLAMSAFSGVMWVLASAIKFLFLPITILIDLIKGIRAAMALLDIVSFLNPAGLIIAAVAASIGAIAGIVYLIIKYRHQIAALFISLGSVIKEYAIDPIIGVIHAIERAITTAENLASSVKGAFSKQHIESNFNAYRAQNAAAISPYYSGLHLGLPSPMAMPQSFIPGISKLPSPMAQNSKHEIIITTKDPGNVIASVETKSKGGTTFVRGRNMPQAG